MQRSQVRLPFTWGDTVTVATCAVLSVVPGSTVTLVRPASVVPGTQVKLTGCSLCWPTWVCTCGHQKRLSPSDCRLAAYIAWQPGKACTVCSRRR